MFNIKEMEEKHFEKLGHTSAEVLYAIEKVAKQKVSEKFSDKRITVTGLQEMIEDEAHEIWNESKYRDEVLGALPLNFSEHIVFSGSIFAEFKNGKWQRRHSTLHNHRMSHEDVRKEYAKADLLTLAQSWNASGKCDGTEFEGRFFVGDTELDEFAIEHDLVLKDDSEAFDIKAIEKVCDCLMIYDYAGAKQNRQFGDQEVIFNKKQDV